MRNFLDCVSLQLVNICIVPVASWVLSNEFGSIGAPFRDIFCSFRSNIGASGLIVLEATSPCVGTPLVVGVISCYMHSFVHLDHPIGRRHASPGIDRWEEATPSLNSRGTSFLDAYFDYSDFKLTRNAYQQTSTTGFQCIFFSQQSLLLFFFCTAMATGCGVLASHHIKPCENISSPHGGRFQHPRTSLFWPFFQANFGFDQKPR
jgi:hypothetical protein